MASPTSPTTLAELLPLAAETSPKAGVVALDGALHPWAEVERSTRALAGVFAEAGVRKGDRIAVMAPKSAASFVAMHAALRCGAVAVPLDPLGAVSFCEAVVAKIEPAVIVGDAMFMRRRLPAVTLASDARLVVLGSPEPLYDHGVAAGSVVALEPFADADRLTDGGEADALPTVDPDGGEADALPTVDPDDPAYIIFTSGSTGVPKGILHSHASAMAYAQAAAEFHELDPTSRLAGTPPLHFDMSTLELYAVPLAGATAVTIGEAEQRFPATLSERIASEAVTHLYMVPFQLRQLQQRGALEQRDLGALRQVAFGGEQLAPGTLTELRAAMPTADFLNVYGPAEVNAVTIHLFPAGGEPTDSVPIGRPCSGATMRIVDDSRREVAPGEAGELIVDSPTRMVGYWRSPELTAERFVGPDPATAHYATGDIVSLDADGVLHFLGRKDHQVKVRGVRIELEAIETILADAPGVAHAIAGRVEVGELDQVAAWVVAQPGAEPEEAILRKWCAERLASAAVPTMVFPTSEVPTTGSGKIDRMAMRGTLQQQVDHVAARKNS